MTFKFQPGQRVTHPDWGGETALVVKTYPMQVRARYSKTRRPLKARPEDCENVVQVDRAFPAAPGSSEKDDHWMECGLVLADPQ